MRPVLLALLIGCSVGQAADAGTLITNAADLVRAAYCDNPRSDIEFRITGKVTYKRVPDCECGR